ncbi:MAG TPA: hypothetical protein VFV50_10675, partial [Bdellovibrionales bacterium]|nr:hypothetical protein [Bdellovibrionales bacterium]
MEILPPWAQALGVKIENIQSWLKAGAPKSALLEWCLDHDKIKEADYLAWARDFYAIPVVKTSLFDQPAPEALWERLRGPEWRDSFFPLLEWDGVVFVGCLEPPPQPRPGMKYLLAPRSLQKKWWRELNASAGQAAELPSFLIEEPAPRAAAPEKTAAALPSLGADKTDSKVPEIPQPADDSGFELTFEVQNAEPEPVIEIEEAVLEAAPSGPNFTMVATPEPVAPPAPNFTMVATPEPAAPPAPNFTMASPPEPAAAPPAPSEHKEPTVTELTGGLEGLTLDPSLQSLTSELAAKPAETEAVPQAQESAPESFEMPQGLSLSTTELPSTSAPSTGFTLTLSLQDDKPAAGATEAPEGLNLSLKNPAPTAIVPEDTSVTRVALTPPPPVTLAADPLAIPVPAAAAPVAPPLAPAPAAPVVAAPTLAPAMAPPPPPPPMGAPKNMTPPPPPPPICSKPVAAAPAAPAPVPPPMMAPPPPPVGAPPAPSVKPPPIAVAPPPLAAVPPPVMAA